MKESEVIVNVKYTTPNGVTRRMEGAVNRQDLAAVTKSFAKEGKEDGLRPGQVSERTGASLDVLACLVSLSDDDVPGAIFSFSPDKITSISKQF